MEDPQANQVQQGRQFYMPSLQEFEAVDFMAPLAGNNTVDCFELEEIFAAAIRAVSAEGNAVAEKVFTALKDLCGMYMDPNNSSSPFTPMGRGPGWSTAAPEDFRGEAADTLNALLDRMTHPALRSRAADIAWLNKRRLVQSAEVAVESYCEIGEGLQTERFRWRLKDPPISLNRRIDLIQRALQIARALDKKLPVRERIKSIAWQAYASAISAEEVTSIERLGQLGMRYGFFSAADIARDAERVAGALQGKPGTYPLAVKELWALAAVAHRKAGDNEAHQRCRVAGVDATLEMARQLQSDPLASAHWLHAAIGELRGVPGQAARVNELQAKLRVAQQSAHGIASFSPDFSAPDAKEMMFDHFMALSLSDALRDFAKLARSASIDDLKAQALSGLETSPLSMLFGARHADEDGKFIADSPSASPVGEQSEEWYKGTIARNQELDRAFVATNQIAPAIMAINQLGFLSERYFVPIVAHSPFVPPNHRYIFALGFTRLLQGDWASACHLLLPQVEHSVRYILKQNGIETSRMNADLTQEDMTLSGMLLQNREDMNRIFTPSITAEIDRLFVQRPGPALRHEIAHGKIADSQCFSSDVVYACWFTYKLCCLPLLHRWDAVIAPAIERETR